MADTWIVVAGGPPAWGASGSQALRMAEAFLGLGYKVLYIECGGDKKPFLRVIGQRKQRAHTVVADLARRDFFVMRAAQLPGLPFAFPEPVRRWNCARTTRRAATFLAAAEAGHVIVYHADWVCPDLFGSVERATSHVYDCADDHAQAPALSHRRLLSRQIVKTEKRLLERADLTVCSARELAAAHAPTARGLAVVPMGVDARHFSRPAHGDPHKALDLPARSPRRPRVGFVGRATERSDWAMVRGAATETPEWHWLVAGPTVGIRPRGPDNLHWLGQTKYDELPRWMQHWSVGLLPHVANSEYNRRTWPMKLLEYLAAGLPVVSTDIPAARQLAEQLPELVFLCEEQTSACLIDTVRRALKVPAWMREAGRAYARQHPWSARAKQVLSHLRARTG